MKIPHYAVLGQPVAHSLSPRIHAEFGRQLGIPLIYLRLDTAELGLAATLARFVAAGGVGANITVPHKARAARLCRQLNPRAEKAGVANTLIRKDDCWIGDNTDGSGLVQDIRQRRGFDLKGCRVLIIGAGGAAQGVAPALLEAGIGSLVIANRSPERALTLATRLQSEGKVQPLTLDSLPGAGRFDLILQATSAGHGGQTLDLPASLLSADSLCIDLNYGPAARDFLQWARQHHCQQAFDGLGMLVEQAADAFALWHGQRPDTHPVYAQLRLGSKQ